VICSFCTGVLRSEWEE